MIRIAGRPRRKWTCEAHGSEGGIRIRLDDDDDAEFWEEIILDRAEVNRLVGEMTAAAILAGGEQPLLCQLLLEKTRTQYQRDQEGGEVTIG